MTKIKAAGHVAKGAKPSPPPPSTITQPIRPTGRAIAGGDPGPGRAQGKAGAGRAAGVAKANKGTLPTGRLPPKPRGPAKGRAARAQVR